MAFGEMDGTAEREISEVVEVFCFFCFFDRGRW